MMMTTMMDLFSSFLPLTNCKGTLTFIITRHSLALVMSFFEQLGFFPLSFLLSLHTYNTRRPPARTALSIISRYVK